PTLTLVQMRQQHLELRRQNGLDPLRSPHTRPTSPTAGSHDLFPGKPYVFRTGCAWRQMPKECHNDGQSSRSMTLCAARYVKATAATWSRAGPDPGAAHATTVRPRAEFSDHRADKPVIILSLMIAVRVTFPTTHP
ncbi:MAG TPA: hypothetical protein VIS09_07350, partial [Streptomyces sp.]